MAATDDRRRTSAASSGSPIGVVCGGGSLPFAVAEAVKDRVILFPVRGYADPQRVLGYPHHWVRFGQLGRLWRLAAAAGCRDIVIVGSVVRPRPLQFWPDDGALRHLRQLLALFRGGDDHLLSGLAKIFEQEGFRILGPHEVVPDILMPAGPIGRLTPRERDCDDIAVGLKLLQATGPFDVGQAAVVANGHVVAIEAAEGTDEMLRRLADLRRRDRIRFPARTGVLVKAPKPGQDMRIDLPSIGPYTIEGAAQADLAGIAVVAGSSFVAEAEQTAMAAEKAGLFVFGITAEGTSP